MKLCVTSKSICLLVAASAVAADPREHNPAFSKTSTNTTATSWTATAYGTATPSGHSSVEPCKKVARLYDDGQNPIPARLAYECLQSVPVDFEGDITLIDEIEAYFEWQSTPAYLADPPAHYDNPKLDIFGSLANVRHKLANKTYKSEYEFALDLYEIPQKSQDDHFAYMPDILNVFRFYRKVQLVSVSPDGHYLPKVYVYGK